MVERVQDEMTGFEVEAQSALAQNQNSFHSENS